MHAIILIITVVCVTRGACPSAAVGGGGAVGGRGTQRPAYLKNRNIVVKTASHCPVTTPACLAVSLAGLVGWLGQVEKEDSTHKSPLVINSLV